MTQRFHIPDIGKLLPGLFLVLIGGLFLFSCKVEKRLHQPGYHVEWVNKKPKNQNVGISDQKRTKASVGLATENKVSGNISLKNLPSNESRPFFPEDIVEASVIRPSQSGDFMSAMALASVDDSRKGLWLRQCETMVLADGRRILIFLVEIGEEEIFYNRCDDPQGKLHSIRRKDVERIEYPDGSRIQIESQEPMDSETSEPPENVQRKKLESLGLGAFALSLFPWIALFAGNSIFFLIVFFVFSAVAFAFSIVSLQRFKAHPNRFIGLGFTITGLIISILALVLLFLVLTTII